MSGTLETHYLIPNIKVDFKLLKVSVPTSVLRTTGFGPNLFAVESFIDKLAHLSGRDPYLYRRDLLGSDQGRCACSIWRRKNPSGGTRCRRAIFVASPAAKHSGR